MTASTSEARALREFAGQPQAMSAAGRRTTADVMQVAVTTARVAATTGGPLSRSASYRRATALRGEGLSFQAQLLPAAPIEEPGPSVHRETAEFAQMPAHPNLDVVTLADTNLLPPDTMGDIGPSQYLVAVNGRVRTLVKATGTADGVLDTSLNAFFQSVRQDQPTTNPRVRYDRRANRWYVLAINYALPNQLLLAVSDSGTITNSTVWSYYSQPNNHASVFILPAGQPCLADFPTLGVDEDALYVGLNQFCGAALPLPTNPSSFDSTSGYVINKSSLLGGVPTLTAFHGLAIGRGAGPYTPQGVDNFDANSNVGYFIGVDNAALGSLQMRRISNPGGTPTMSDNIPIAVAATELPIDVPHAGSSVPLSAQDDRLNQAVVRNGRLWTNHQIEVNATGAAQLGGGRTAVRWYELQNLDSTPTVRQFGTVFDPTTTTPLSYFMGSVMVSGQGHMALGATVAGAAAFVNAAVTGRLASDPLAQMNGTPQVYSSNASFTYNLAPDPGPPPSQPWGGYSYTSLDPSDDMTMWTLQQYVNATNSYGLRLVRLQAPPPAPVLSVSPAVVTPGRTGLVLTVTGSSAGGAGYFDPGAGFANRLAAAFSGAGVTITNTTVISPTQIALTVDTTSAPTGFRTLNLTNPDGQATSGPNAIEVQTNLAPTAAADAYSLRTGQLLSIPAPGLLSNDSDPNGEPLTAQLQVSPTHGTLTLNANGSFSYVSAAGYVGPDSFTYVATDGLLSAPPAIVSLTILPNVAPVATADTYATAFSVPLSVPAPGVLGNDSDADGDALMALLVTGPTSGTLTLNPNGSFGYTPTPNFAGTDSFTYRAFDGAATSSVVTVSLSVSQPTTVQPPTGLIAHSVTGNTVTLRWTPPAVGPSVTGYVLEGGINPGEVLASIPTNTGTAPVFTLMAPTGSFYVRIHALAGAQRSAASNEIRIHVNVPVNPSAPTGLLGLVNGSTLNLAWRNTYQGGAPTSMLLDVTGSEITTIPLGFAEGVGFAGVPGGTYTLRLRAVNAGGPSAPSDPITLTFPSDCSGPPQAPTNVVAYRIGSLASVLWEPAASGPAPTEFTVNVTGAFVGSFGTSARTLSGLVGPGTYNITIVASNPCGPSAASLPQTLIVP